MSAERLREVAALMRARAEASIASPWSIVDNFGVIRAEYGSPDDGLPVNGEDCGCGGGIGHRETAEHIASWHPAVALAVADLLDNAAEDLTMQEPGGDLSKRWDMRVHIAGDRALAVANAYLGDPA